MRDFLRSSGRRVRAGWFWPLVLLTLPMCSLDSEGARGGDPDPDPPPHAFDPGNPPLAGAVLCDIPQVVGEGSGCATDTEAALGMSRAHAAVALNLGETNAIVLDFSDTTACGGKPRKVEFYGPFPDGLTVCLNCGQQIPAVYAGLFDVCVAQCKDLITFGDGPIPPEGVDAYCTANVRLSTNFEKDTCSPDFCSDGGTPIPNPTDPRRNPEDVTWVDFVNTSAVGSTLSFAGPETSDFSGGAASEQLITTGDAWVEFEAGQTGVSHLVGLRTSCDNITDCPDEDGTLADIPLGLSLNVSGGVFVIENGDVLAGPFPDYATGERFRIHVTDHNDGTADISFSRLPAPCTPNMPCTETLFYSHPVGTGPGYPLRLDATFREANASVKNVTIMRIIE
jgi:hypothetical protein